MGDGRPADIAYVVDQSHNLKGKIEAMIQTVDDGAGAGREGGAGRLPPARRRAAATDLVAPRRACRTRSPSTSGRSSANGGRAKGLPADPLAAFRESGYLERITRERAGRRQAAGSASPDESTRAPRPNRPVPGSAPLPSRRSPSRSPACAR